MDTTITVIIATKDRSGALAEISLPSLLRQEPGFDVLIWDASADDRSRDVVQGYQERFRSAGIPLRYERAPRAGLTSQRNDAIKTVDSDVVFFIDDDSEVTRGG